MNATLAEMMPIWILLIGAGLLAVAGWGLKSTAARGPLALLLIFLAGVSLTSPVTSMVQERPASEGSASARGVTEAAHAWRVIWQVIILSVGFLVVLMTLDEADTTHNRTLQGNSAVRYALVLCSMAGLCGLACTPTLWGLLMAGRLSFWPLLPGFRRAEDDSVHRNGESSIARITSAAFWKTVRASFSRRVSLDANGEAVFDPVIMLIWRELWSMLLLISGLVILAVWTGCSSLLLSELREFQPGGQQLVNWGIAGVLLVIVGAGWTIPLHLETLDIAERGDRSSSAWLIAVQTLSAVITVSTVVVATPLGRIVSAETMLIIFAGWNFVLGSYIVRRQIHLRRWLAGLVIAQSGWWMTSIALAVGQQKMTAFDPQVGLVYPHNLSTVPYLMIADMTAILGFCAVCRFVLNGERELTYIDDLRGLMRQQPAAAGLATVSLLSLLGMPLNAGFWGRWQIVCGLWSVQLIDPRTGLPAVHGGLVLLTFAMLWSQIIMMQAMWQPLRMMLFESSAGRIATEERQAALSAAILAAFIAVGIGLMPDALLRELRHITAL